MATQATDILSVDAAKMHIEADDGIPNVNAKVTQAIKSAVAHMEKETGYPLIDREEWFDVYPRGTSLPVILPCRFVINVLDVQYWQQSQKLREEPSGTIAVSALGRRKEDPYRGHTVIWEPADGWPDRLFSSPIRFQVTRGYDLNPEDERPKDEHLRQAIILLTRHFYDQPERFESDFAVNSLVNAWKWTA